MFVNTKFILFYLLFFEFFCSSCDSGKIYYHEPIINKVNTGYTNNDERDSNGEQKGNKNNKKGDDDKKEDDEQRRYENDKTWNIGDEQKAASTVPLADSSMRILPNVGNTCYFDSALQVFFRCELMDKETFSGGDIELEEVYDIFSNYLLNDNCKEAIEKEKLKSLYKKIIEKKSLSYKIGNQDDPYSFFGNLMSEKILFVYNNLLNQEQNMSNAIFNVQERLFEEEGKNSQQQKIDFQKQEEFWKKEEKKKLEEKCKQNYIIGAYSNFDGKGNRKITRIKECDEIIFPGNNTKFKLIATINFIGETVDYGHFVAHILDQKKNEWKCYNDLRSSAEPPWIINFKENGYLFFYKKQE